MDHALLQFDAIQFFLGARLHGGSLSNFNFFNLNTQIRLQNRKVHRSNCQDTNFHISDISLRIRRRHRNYN